MPEQRNYDCDPHAASLLDESGPYREEIPPEVNEAVTECNQPEPVVHVLCATDPVNRPEHYTKGKIEVYDFIEDQKLSYAPGQVIKYVTRAPHKGNELEDYKKAQWYLSRIIAQIEKTL